MEKQEVQKVKVYLSIYGDYTAFHEISVVVEYDITNKKQIGDMTLEECENFNSDDSDYGDTELHDAILIDGRYYYSI